MRFVLLVAALAASTPGVTRAQQGIPREPTVWLTLGSGYLNLASVADGATASGWDFGDGWSWRLSVEKALGSSAALGVHAMWMRAPLRYQSSASCGACDAHATVAYYGPVFRYGRGDRFHQLFEASVGVMQYGSFVEDGTGNRLPPERANRDFAFSLGWGLGWAFRPDWQLEVIGSRIYAQHERGDLPGNTQTLRQHFVIRAGLRIGY
jgi:hypothetical protein